MIGNAATSSLICFAIISSILFTTLCPIYVGANDQNQSEVVPLLADKDENDVPASSINHQMNGELPWKRVDELLHSNESFLAREDTPVWIASYINSIENINYKKLEENRVKKAVDYWNSERFEDLPIVNQNERHDVTYEMWSLFSEQTLKRDEMVILNDRIKTQESEGRESSMEVAHLSLLIMMDYATNWPTDEMSQEKLINERILYALAFWNAVDLQLRDVQGPKVRLRISGIIIGAHPKATPYVYENRKGNHLRMDIAHAAMLEYWIDQATSYQNFPLTGYHAIATMTDSVPAGPRHPYAASSLGPPCKSLAQVTGELPENDDLPSKSQRERNRNAFKDELLMYKLRDADIGGLIFPDDLAFSGVQVAVRETGHTLGAIIRLPTQWDYTDENRYVMAGDVNIIGRKWSLRSLREISNRIHSNGWCLKEPREFGQSGNPIELILPGVLVPASNQCKSQRFADGKVGWHRSSCRHLYCKKRRSYWRWYSDSGPPLEGTISPAGKMCVDGKPIDNSTIIDAAISRQKTHSTRST